MRERLLPHDPEVLCLTEADGNFMQGEGHTITDEDSRLDIGCVAAHGWFACDDTECHVIKDQGKPATAFLLELIARLQGLATVPMIDIRAYAKWLTD